MGKNAPNKNVRAVNTDCYMRRANISRKKYTAMANAIVIFIAEWQRHGFLHSNDNQCRATAQTQDEQHQLKTQ